MSRPRGGSLPVWVGIDSSSPAVSSVQEAAKTLAEAQKATHQAYPGAAKAVTTIAESVTAEMCQRLMEAGAAFEVC